MSQLFREEALKHKSERLLGEVIIAQPPALSVLTLLITLSVSLALLFLISNDYTRRENALGYLVPTKGVVAIYPTQPGLLSELYVNEGDVVEQGQALFKIQIDQRRTSDNYLSEQLIQELQEQKTRLRESVVLEQKNLATQLERQDNYIEQLNAEIRSFNSLLRTQTRQGDLALNAYDRAKELAGRGMLSRSDMDNIEKAYLDNQQQTKNLQLNLSDKQFELQQARIDRDTYIISNQKAISDIENRLSDLNRQIASTQVEQYNVVHAPIAGNVTALIPNLGQRLDTGIPAFSLLPQDSQLEAHLYVPTRAIGFVVVGQNVNLRYDAFPYQRFGLYQGIITQVSNAVLTRNESPAALAINEPTYKIVVRLNAQQVKAYGEKVPLRPGILLSADIELDKRSLLEWLLDPLYSLQGIL
jgi:membrane fusion protein